MWILKLATYTKIEDHYLKPIAAQGLFLEGLNPYFIIQIGNIIS